jgi:hypothetical protein
MIELGQRIPVKQAVDPSLLVHSINVVLVEHKSIVPEWQVAFTTFLR